MAAWKEHSVKVSDPQSRKKSKGSFLNLHRGGTLLLDSRKCEVGNAAELDAEIRDIFALDSVQRGDEICGTLYVDYEDESVKKGSLIPALEARGVNIVWRKKTG